MKKKHAFSLTSSSVSRSADPVAKQVEEAPAAAKVVVVEALTEHQQHRLDRVLGGYTQGELLATFASAQRKHEERAAALLKYNMNKGTILYIKQHSI